MTLVENMNQILATQIGDNLPKFHIDKKVLFSKKDLYVPYCKPEKKRSKSERHFEQF